MECKERDEKNAEGYCCSSFMEGAISASKNGTVAAAAASAYIASVIRNVETFNYFLELTEQENLTVDDITEKVKPFHLLPYLKSYPRATIRLFCISYK